MFLLKRLVPSVTLATAMMVMPTIAQEGEDTIVVRGTLIPDEKKSTSEISSLLDADDFERAGDSDIAAALRRVTGLSIQGGRFVVIRGLNERYSSATLNGLPLPSPEPLRRAAPLDLFPTSVIESTLVQKTFSPQFSGEFGGGVVELRSKSIPDEDFLEIGLGLSANTVTSLRNGLFHEGSDTDVFGFDDGLRDLPGEASLLFGTNNLSPAEQNLVDTSFEQQKTLLITQEDVPVNGSGSISFGKRFYSDGGFSLGTVFYAGYANDWQIREGERQRLDGVNGSDTEFAQTRQEVSISALSSTGLEFNADHSLQLTGLLVRKSLKRSEIATEEFFGDDRTFLRENTDFVERELWQGQLTGQHAFPDLSDLSVDWKLSYGEATRDAPYERRTGFRLDDLSGDFLFTTEEGINSITFRDLLDENFASGIDFKLPFDAFSTPVEFSFGAAYTDTQRTSSVRDFEFRGIFPPEIVGSRADLIFSDEVLGLESPRVRFVSNGGQPDNFEGSLEVMAGYAAADIELGPFVRLAVGARFEDSTQETLTFTTDNPENIAIFPAIEEDYLLPAVTLTWNPVGNFQVRGGFSQTITRPQFRELSPSIFEDPDNDVRNTGNPFLQNTEIDNFDVRAEWYFDRGEFVTLGLFYKDMTNPIEDIIFALGETPTTTYVNAPAAELYGAEFEFEKNFYLDELFGDNWLTSGNTLIFKTNYTYSKGEVSDDGSATLADTSSQRVDPLTIDANAFIEDGSRLTGLSEHLFNLQIGIETPSEASVALVTNYASERTLFRAERVSDGFLNPVVEEPPITLDFIINQPIEIREGQYDLTVKVQNLLNDDFDAFYEGRDTVGAVSADAPFLNYDLGRTVSFGVKRRF
ncbi:MAG: TonB-dependent receptor [Pseudomonadota bacterium]